MLFFFFYCLHFAPSFFFWEKDGWCPCPNVGFYYALLRCVIGTKRHRNVYYMSKLCIIRNKICVWATPRCVGWWPDTSRSGNWAVIKKEADNTFVLSRMSTHCWFNVLLWLKYKQAFLWVAMTFFASTFPLLGEMEKKRFQLYSQRNVMCR